MANVTGVYPGSSAPSHDVRLSDEAREIGLLYAKTARMLQEIPISDPSRPFLAQQKSWTGGYFISPIGRFRQ